MNPLSFSFVRATAAALAIGGVCCGGSTEAATPPDAVEASTPGSDGDASSVADSRVSCPPQDAGDIFLGVTTPMNGTASGPSFASTLCNVGASLDVRASEAGPSLISFEFGDGTFRISEPASASGGVISGTLVIPAAAPGTFTSSDTPDCSTVDLTYELPSAPPADCGDGGIAGPDCPVGCIAACSSFGCSPCSPVPPYMGYEAVSGAGCPPPGGPAVGSWTLVLTSVEPYTGNDTHPGLRQYLVHGSFTAQLVGGLYGVGNRTVTANLAF